MVRFEVESVSRVADWSSVVWVPDELEIRLVTSDGERGGSYSGLDRWYHLYQCVRLHQPAEHGPPALTIEEVQEGVRVRYGVSEVTTYEELKTELEALLTEIFRQLDELSTPRQRERGLNDLDGLTPKESDMDAFELYEMLSTRYRRAY